MGASSALQNKIENQRQAASYELPKARLCAAVVLSFVVDTADIPDAISKLKKGLGKNWSHVTAFQFMSGRQAKFSAECSEDNERASMLLAHQIAEHVYKHVSIGSLSFTEIGSMLHAFNAADNPLA